MGFNSVTIKDIAIKLGLSKSTVSRALADSHEINKETKERVIACAAQLNYKPNTFARTLKGGKTKSIGIIVSTIDNQFFSQVINGCDSVAFNKGYTVIITQTHESYDLEIANLRQLIDRSVDGLLVSISTETNDTNHFKSLSSDGFPIVFFDRVIDAENCHKIISDNYKGAYEATMHLINAGYKKIAHVTSSPQISISKERLRGYKQALTDAGLEYNESYVKYCYHGGREIDEIDGAINQLLMNDNPPDALFTASDRITTNTFLLLKQRGIIVPDQLGLLGFTNTHLAAGLSPALTTITQPGFEMGKRATEMLISQIEKGDRVTEFETIILPTTLHKRESSASKPGVF